MKTTFLFAALGLGGAMAADPASSVLWSNAPAREWMTEALPIGNGRLGGMLFGGTAWERIQFNEQSLWTGDDQTEGTGAYQAFGDLILRLGHGSITDYRRELDLDRALHRVSYAAQGVRYQQRAFASHPAQVLVWQLSADAPGSCTGRLWLTAMQEARIEADGLRLRCSGTLSNGLAFEAEVRVIADGGRVAVFREAAPEDSNGVARDLDWKGELPAEGIAFTGCDRVMLVLAAATNYVPDSARNWRGAHPRAAVKDRLDAAAKSSFETLLTTHVTDYQGLYRRFSLDLGSTAAAVATRTTRDRLEAYGQPEASDPDLEELLANYGRYLLIACSRPGGLPANLQGLWNDSNRPPWRSDYHSNINLQMNYWPALPTNLAECNVPLADYINSLRRVRAERTREKYGSATRGWTVQTENNIFGGASWKWNPPGSAWYAQHLWEHYAFTRDATFLKERAYPVLKEICEFWQDRLKQRPDGTLVVPDGWSPEHGPVGEGVTYDQMIVHDLFTNYVEASEALGCDTEYRATIAALRSRLLKPKIGRWGQLQEWEQDVDDPKDDHRHVSHLFALHPGRQIAPTTTPDLARAARVSLTARGEAGTGWSRAWKINFWARLHDGDHAYTMLRKLLTLVTEKGGTPKARMTSGGGVYANLLDAHPPFQIDGNFGSTAGIAEMLVQSHLGEIHLLPALPKAWPTGSVTGLCARGACTVDLSWQDGQLTRARIVSSQGGRYVIRHGAVTATFSLAAHQAVLVKGDLSPLAAEP